MEKKSSNKNLHKANKAKKDEFYTQLVDIQNELKHYKDQFKNKIVYCNCDDPFESNFFKHFASAFNDLKLKKLIATSYANSPIIGGQLPLFKIKGSKGKQPLKIEITEVPDINKDGAIDIEDVKKLLEHNKKYTTPLKEGGDFRSKECVELLKQADIVVTNPPFSLFREYVAQLVEHNKKFLIIGSLNAITYKEIFKLIKENKLWMGYGFSGGNAYFQTPYPREFAKGVYDEKTGLVKFRNVAWFTNLELEKRHQDIDLYKKYSPENYPRYDNYDAINVDKTRDIPMDYTGAIGVPISFLDKYNPDQFEIIKFRKGDDDKDLIINGRCPFFRILIKNKKVGK
jgi:hypothetical protein